MAPDMIRLAGHGKQHWAGRFITPTTIVFHIGKADDQGHVIVVVSDVIEQGSKSSTSTAMIHLDRR
jgi:hypothetical protein